MIRLCDIIDENTMTRLNEITKAEFELGWNMGEISRTVINDMNKDAKHNVLARKLQEELSKKVPEGYKLHVSGLGSITLYKLNEDDPCIMHELERLYSENSTILPYIYVMGKKVGKKVYLETLDKLH